MNKRTWLVLCVALAVLAVAVLLLVYSLPRSFSQIVTDPQDSFSSVTLGMLRSAFAPEASGAEAVAPKYESYTLEQAGDGSHVDALYDILSGTTYRKSIRNLIPGMTDSYYAYSQGYVFTMIISAGDRHWQINILSDGMCSVVLYSSRKSVLYKMTDPEVLETLAAYVKQYGVETTNVKQ